MSRSARAAARKETASRQEQLSQRFGRLKGGLPNLDRIIHERIRLGIVSALASGASLSFNQLKELLETTDGNLSRHATKLEEAGYVATRKSTSRGRQSLTQYRLTDQGRKALEHYLGHMEAVIRAARGGGAVS